MKTKAFTLAELLIGIAVFSVLMISTYNLFVGGNKQYLQGKSVVESLTNMRLVLALMKKDVDRMQLLKTEDGGSSRKIIITTANAEIVEWVWTKSDSTLQRIPKGVIFGSRISWGGMKDFLVQHVARFFDKVGGESGPPVGNSNVTAFEVFEIDLNKFDNLNHYSEFHGIKVKLTSAFREQKREIYLSRYMFPYTAAKRKIIKWD